MANSDPFNFENEFSLQNKCRNSINFPSIQTKPNRSHTNTRTPINEIKPKYRTYNLLGFVDITIDTGTLTYLTKPLARRHHHYILVLIFRQLLCCFIRFSKVRKSDRFSSLSSLRINVKSPRSPHSVSQVNGCENLVTVN